VIIPRKGAYVIETRYADIILPVCSILERDGLGKFG
jgi:hypothetical protein